MRTRSAESALRSPRLLAYTVRVTKIATSYRYIVPTPGVGGGHARVHRTRIGVHDVIGLLQNGETIDSLVANCFQDLTYARCTSVWRSTRTTELRLTSWSPGTCRSHREDNGIQS